MVSIVTAVVVSCLFVATVTSGAYILSQAPRSPATDLMHLCLDEQTLVAECLRYPPLLRHLLIKLAHSLQTEPQSRRTSAVLDDKNNLQSPRPAKRTRDNISGFYSNW